MKQQKESKLRSLFFEALKSDGIKLLGSNDDHIKAFIGIEYVAKWYNDLHAQSEEIEDEDDFDTIVEKRGTITNHQVAKFLEEIEVEGELMGHPGSNWCYGLSLEKGYTSFKSIAPYLDASQKSLNPSDIGRNKSQEILKVFIDYIQNLVNISK